MLGFSSWASSRGLLGAGGKVTVAGGTWKMGKMGSDLWTSRKKLDKKTYCIMISHVVHHKLLYLISLYILMISFVHLHRTKHLPSNPRKRKFKKKSHLHLCRFLLWKFKDQFHRKIWEVRKPCEPRSNGEYDMTEDQPFRGWASFWKLPFAGKLRKVSKNMVE